MSAGGGQNVALDGGLISWLLEDAYPLWAARGVDTVRGGFHERLTLAGEPTDDARRARALLTPAGAVIDDRALLYDQAFALLAFATTEPLMRGTMDLVREGEQLRSAIYRHLKRAGPGFEPGVPHGPPLLSNPHMHLLEAALAWQDAGGGDEWRVLADELGGFALAHLMDSATGMIHETYDEAWLPTRDAAGRLLHPGHQFEWAWLLMRWGRADAREAALRLMDLGERHGVHNGVVINSMTDNGSPHNRSARLWPQTERLRAAALAAPRSRTPRTAAAAAGGAPRRSAAA
jgi:mannose/cellobiose epimerase-like protein (N-acyl-D-glucosamine 2-epimerase family)